MASALWLEKTWTGPDGQKVRAGTGARSSDRIARLKVEGYKAGGPYYVVWREPGTTRKSYESFRSLDYARTFLSTKATELQTGTSVPKADRRQLFGDFGDRVLRESRNIAPSTADWYRDHWSRHVKPKLGTLPIEAVTTAKLREFFDKLHESGRTGTVTAVRRVMVKVLNQAASEGLFPKGSPMAPLRGSFRKPSRKTVEPLPIEIVEAFADAIEPRCRLAVLLAGYCGLRGGRSEGIRLQDVRVRDRDGNLVPNPTLRVEQAVRTVRGHAEIAEPKTEASRRPVSVPRFLVEEIDRHIGEFGTTEDGRLFESVRNGGKNGGLVSHFTLDKALSNAAEKLGVPKPRFHDLRHTCAALMIEQGAHAKAIQERMRHSSITITMDVYGHLLEGRDQDIAEGLDAMRAKALAGAKAVPQLVTVSEAS